MQNADRDEKPSVSSNTSDLGFPDDEDDVHPEGKITCTFTIFIVITHAGNSRGMDRLISCVRHCVSVCLSVLLKENGSSYRHQSR